MHRDGCKRMIVIQTGSVQKLNSYILQSSCRGGMQRVIRSDTAHSAHTRLSTHYYIRTFSVCYQRIPKYTQRTIMYAPTHNTEATHVHLRAISYIHNYIRIAQSETLYTNDNVSLKRVCRSQPLQSETSQDLKKLSL